MMSKRVSLPLPTCNQGISSNWEPVCDVISHFSRRSKSRSPAMISSEWLSKEESRVSPATRATPPTKASSSPRSTRAAAPPPTRSSAWARGSSRSTASPYSGPPTLRQSVRSGTQETPSRYQPLATMGGCIAQR